MQYSTTELETLRQRINLRVYRDSHITHLDFLLFEDVLKVLDSLLADEEGKRAGPMLTRCAEAAVNLAAYDRPEVIRLLEKYGARTVAELKPDDRPDFLLDVWAAIEQRKISDSPSRP